MASKLMGRLWPLRRAGAARPDPAFSVLMVCTGNICRSPTAEVVLRRRLQALELDGLVLVDSAGTHAHEGSPPDPRTQKIAQQRGYDMAKLRGRQLVGDDFLRFDLILAMDGDHMDWMQRFAPAGAKAEQALFTRHARRFAGAEAIPDPYYGAPEGFALVLDMIEDAAEGWLPHLRQRLTGQAALARPGAAKGE